MMVSSVPLMVLLAVFVSVFSARVIRCNVLAISASTSSAKCASSSTTPNSVKSVLGTTWHLARHRQARLTTGCVMLQSLAHGSCLLAISHIVARLPSATANLASAASFQAMPRAAIAAKPGASGARFALQNAPRCRLSGGSRRKVDLCSGGGLIIRLGAVQPPVVVDVADVPLAQLAAVVVAHACRAKSRKVNRQTRKKR